jgi:hypothetical protein
VISEADLRQPTFLPFVFVLLELFPPAMMIRILTPWRKELQQMKGFAFENKKGKGVCGFCSLHFPSLCSVRYNKRLHSQ